MKLLSIPNVTGNVIGGTITRGNNRGKLSYWNSCIKYEIGGVLHRVNKTHDMNNVTVDNPITFDLIM